MGWESPGSQGEGGLEGQGPSPRKPAATLSKQGHTVEDAVPSPLPRTLLVCVRQAGTVLAIGLAGPSKRTLPSRPSQSNGGKDLSSPEGDTCRQISHCHFSVPLYTACHDKGISANGGSSRELVILWTDHPAHRWTMNG